MRKIMMYHLHSVQLSTGRFPCIVVPSSSKHIHSASSCLYTPHYVAQNSNSHLSCFNMCKNLTCLTFSDIKRSCIAYVKRKRSSRISRLDQHAIMLQSILYMMLASTYFFSFFNYRFYGSLYFTFFIRYSQYNLINRDLRVCSIHFSVQLKIVYNLQFISQKTTSRIQLCNVELFI